MGENAMSNFIRRIRPAPVLALGLAALALWLGAPSGLRGAQDDRPEGGRVADTLFGARGAVDRVGVAIEERIKDLEKAMENIEARLGRSSQPPTLSNSFERRVQDLEKRIAALERDMKRMDERVRRLETRRP